MICSFFSHNHDEDFHNVFRYYFLRTFHTTVTQIIITDIVPIYGQFWHYAWTKYIQKRNRKNLTFIQHTVLKWCNNYFLHLLLSHSMLHPSGKKFPQNKINNESGIGSGYWWEGPTEMKSASTIETLRQQLDVWLQLSGTCHVQCRQFSNIK